MKGMFPQVRAKTRIGYGNYSSSVSVVVPNLTATSPSPGDFLLILVSQNNEQTSHSQINCGSWIDTMLRVHPSS